MVVADLKQHPLTAQWLPLMLWMAAIFLVSSQSKQDIPSFDAWDTLVKKGGHFLAYLILAVLARRATDGADRPWLWAILITIGYAISDEWHQRFVPTRQGSGMDVLIDAAGGIMGLLICRRWPLLLPAARRLSQ